MLFWASTELSAKHVLRATVELTVVRRSTSQCLPFVVPLFLSLSIFFFKIQICELGWFVWRRSVSMFPLRVSCVEIDGGVDQVALEVVLCAV